MNYYIATSHSIVVLVYSHVNLFRLAVLIMLLNPFCHPFLYYLTRMHPHDDSVFCDGAMEVCGTCGILFDCTGAALCLVP
jgi:hypothetical protein